MRALAQDRPRIFVIDLSRRPSDGLAVGVALRQNPATRFTPIVFAGGDPEKIARVRQLLPDATYAGWDTVRVALSRAIQTLPKNPVVP